MSVQQAIAAAEVILPGTRADTELDPRWQAIIAVGEFVASDPEPVWTFARRWGASPDDDLRSAIATCLVEHLLEYHFAAFFPRVEKAVAGDALFADCVARCWALGQADEPPNRARFEALKARVAAA